MNKIDEYDAQYLDWLYSRVEDPDAQKGLSHWMLIRKLFCTMFEWTKSSDINRAMDGKYLRRHFELEELTNAEIFSDSYKNWLDQPCSMLEMIIGVAKRLSIVIDSPLPTCFWSIIRNLDLLQFHDDSYFEIEVSARLQKFMNRDYDEDGTGGLFPIRNPMKDQRDLDILDQMNNYVIERFL